MNMKDEPAFSLTAYMAYYKDDEAESRRPKAGEERIYTYVKAVSFELMSCTTLLNIAKASS